MASPDPSDRVDAARRAAGHQGHSSRAGVLGRGHPDLGLGIGGNTAIFSVVDQLRLRPLPYPRGDDLVRISERSLTRDPNSAVDGLRQE